MPTNLHAIIRYRKIDKCLCRPSLNWSRGKLAEECGKALREKIKSLFKESGEEITIFSGITGENLDELTSTLEKFVER